MASNGRNILNTAMGIHNSAVNTYGQLDSATKKFQNKKHSKSIIKSAKDNIFEFPVFVSSSVPMDYATATNTLLEQCYASYLQMAITAQGPVISATEARNGTQFAKFKSDTNKYLECVEMQYAHDACHNLIQEADYSIEFSLLSYEDSDARVINEHVDYQPLSEFNHFFQEEVIPEDDVDWDWLYYMEANTDYMSPMLPIPNMDTANNAPYEITDPNGDSHLQFYDNKGRTRYGTEDEVIAHMMNNGGMSEHAAREMLPRIRAQARAQGFRTMTNNELTEAKLHDFIQQSGRMSISDRLSDSGKITGDYDTFIRDFADENGIDQDSLLKLGEELANRDATNYRLESLSTYNNYMRNIQTQIQNGIPLTTSQMQILRDEFHFDNQSFKNIAGYMEKVNADKNLGIDNKKYEKAFNMIKSGESITAVKNEIPGFSNEAYLRIKKELEDKAGLTSVQKTKEETNNMLQDVNNLSKDAFKTKYIDTGKITETEYNRLKSIAKSEETSKTSKAESDRISAIYDKIKSSNANEKIIGTNIGGIEVTETEFNALKTLYDRETSQAKIKLSSDRFKAITDKIDRGVAISDEERQNAGLDETTIKNMEDLAEVRHDIEKHNEEILKRQAEKTKGYYRALDDIKTTADTASSIGQAVATGTRAAKEIATFKSDVSIKKSQAEEAKSKAEMTKTESELKKKQLRDYEKDKDLERRSKEQQIEKSKQDIESSKHQMKMAEKNAKMTEQQVRNSSKTEGPKFIDETKIQKLNSLKPMLMSVDLRVIDDIGGLSTPVQYIVGVKTHSRMIDAEILPEVAEYPLKKMDEISRKAKWRAGELKFLKDIVFKIDEKKQTAADKKDPRRNWYRRLYDLAHMKGDAPAAKVAEGKSLFETYFKDKIGKSKAITGVIPNASIVITQADVNNIKAQTKINLLKGSSARKFCKELFLLGFVIIDDDAESVKCMFPDLHNDFEVHSLASIKKQVSMLDTAGTKTKDMFKLLG